MQFGEYVQYMMTQEDEEPLYVFDDDFGEVCPNLLQWYVAPSLLSEDLTACLDDVTALSAATLRDVTTSDDVTALSAATCAPSCWWPFLQYLAHRRNQACASVADPSSSASGVLEDVGNVDDSVTSVCFATANDSDVRSDDSDGSDRCQVTGVSLIDFSDSGIGDPLFDFISLYVSVFDYDVVEVVEVLEVLEVLEELEAVEALEVPDLGAHKLQGRAKQRKVPTSFAVSGRMCQNLLQLLKVVAPGAEVVQPGGQGEQNV
eukprot:gene9836-9995_t